MFVPFCLTVALVCFAVAYVCYMRDFNPVIFERNNN
jgi:hypothetical protein